MQGPGVGFPVKVHGGARCFCIDIIGLDGQRAIQHLFFFRVAPEISVTDRNLLQREKVAWVELDRALQISCGFFPAPLAPLDITLQLEYPKIIGQGLASNFQFSQSAIVIEVASIEISGTCEVCFTCIGPEAKRRFDGRSRQGQAVGSMVEAKGIKRVMRVSELTIRLEIRWVMCDSLVQQIGRLEEIRFRATAKACRQKKIFGARVEIERRDVARRRTFDCVLFTWQKFGLKLLGNRLRDFTLNREHIRKLAIISLPPELSVGARINQLGVDTDAIARALNASFHDIRDPELLADLAQLAHHSASVLHY